MKNLGKEGFSRGRNPRLEQGRSVRHPPPEGEGAAETAAPTPHPAAGKEAEAARRGFRAGDEQRSAGTLLDTSSRPRAESVGDNSQLIPSSRPSRCSGASPEGPAALRAQPRRHHVRRGRDRLGIARILRERLPLRSLRARIRQEPRRLSSLRARIRPRLGSRWAPLLLRLLRAPLGFSPRFLPGTAPAAGCAAPAMGAAGAPPP